MVKDYIAVAILFLFLASPVFAGGDHPTPEPTPEPVAQCPMHQKHHGK